MGVTVVWLTMTPIGKLFWDLASIIQESHRAILEVLPFTTFTELARIQIALYGLPTHTWPSTVSEPGLRSSLLTLRLIAEVVTGIVEPEMELDCILLDVEDTDWVLALPWWYKVHIWANTNGWTSLGHVKVLKASNPNTFPPCTQARSDYIQSLRVTECYVGVQELYLDL